MSVGTHSRFYYGFDVDALQYTIDFSEGSGELNASLVVGSYTMTELAVEIARALNEVGGQVYTVTVNRATRKFTVSAGSAFSILVSSGSRIGTGAYTLFGFQGVADLTSASTYTGAAAGSQYQTQFRLQSYVEPDDQVAACEGVVNKAADGTVEVFKFGQNNFMEANLRYITSRSLPTGCVIRNAGSGHQDARDLMDYLITKNVFEFMPDENDSNTYLKYILESTPEDQNGLRYKLKEMLADNLVGFYETGVLVFRKIG